MYSDDLFYRKQARLVATPTSQEKSMLQPTRRTTTTLHMTMSLLTAHSATQQQDPPPALLRIAPAQADMQVRGELVGYQTLTYLFDSAAGADTTISLDHPGRASLYHNVIAPSGAVLFNGSMNGPRFRANLGERGRCHVRVYLMRNDARRSMRVPFTLHISQSMSQQRPRPTQADGPSFDCRKARGLIETAVCRSPALSKLDARLNYVYRDAIVGASARRATEIRRDQRQWLAERRPRSRELRFEQCLITPYNIRIGQLEPKR